MKRHLLSDVPVGLLLSGGVDSGALLALMNLYGQSWRTYTVGYGSSFSDDELKDAADTAARFSVAAHDCHARSSDLRGDAEYDRVLLWRNPSHRPRLFLCILSVKRAREDVKVALIGQGPDELFAGYRRHLGVRYGSYWGAIPSWLRTPIASTIGALPRNETLKRGIYSLDVKDRLKRYQHVLSLMPGGCD